MRKARKINSRKDEELEARIRAANLRLNRALSRLNKDELEEIEAMGKKFAK